MPVTYPSISVRTFLVTLTLLLSSCVSNPADWRAHFPSGRALRRAALSQPRAAPGRRPDRRHRRRPPYMGLDGACDTAYF